MIDEKTAQVDAILDGYHVATLTGMAEAAGLLDGGGGRRPSKAELKASLRDQFFARERVLASLAQLSTRERAVLDRLLLRGGVAPTRSLRREAVKAGLATEGGPRRPDAASANRAYSPPAYVPYAGEGYIGNPRRASSAVFEDVIARLTLRGLVFSGYAASADVGGVPFKLQYHPADTLYIPQIIQDYLPRPEGQPPVAEPPPPTVKAGEPALLLRDLYIYWDHVRRNGAPLTRGGLVAKRTLRAINESLLVPDPLLEKARNEADTGRLALLRGLLEALGLVQARPMRLQLPGRDPLEIPGFWSWPQARQLAACLAAWPSLAGLSELSGDAARCEPQYMPAREALLKALAALPPDLWLDVEELTERIRREDLDFMFAEHSRVEASRDTWYYGYSNGYLSGRRSDILQTFERLEQGFIDGCLAGFLHEIGLVDLGYDGERLAAFRVNPAGRAILELSPGETSEVSEASEVSPDTGRLVVQPNFQILALGPVSLATLARLDLVADRERAGQGAFEYRLSRESVYRAQQQGLEAPAILRFLEVAAGAELPQNVRRSLEEWGAHHERIVFRSGVSLLQAASPALLAELLSGPQTSPLLARPVAPEVALVAEGGQQRLVAALVKQGLFPAVSGPDPQSADRGVIIQEDGAIQAVHPVPSLHLRARLARLAEESASPEQTSVARWHLTPASVRRAGGSKARVLRLLEELGRLQRGPLPEALVERVKAWGGYHGEAAAEALTLIEFRDLATLEELARRPALGTLLTPFPAGERALAIVAAGRLAEVKQILWGLGVRVREGL